MRYGLIALLVLSGPAYAHHEVIVATSLMPTVFGLALIATAALAASRRHLWHLLNRVRGVLNTDASRK